jgi:hypothetical protein
LWFAVLPLLLISAKGCAGMRGKIIQDRILPEPSAPGSLSLSACIPFQGSPPACRPACTTLTVLPSDDKDSPRSKLRYGHNEPYLDGLKHEACGKHEAKAKCDSFALHSLHGGAIGPGDKLGRNLSAIARISSDIICLELNIKSDID